MTAGTCTQLASETALLIIIQVTPLVYGGHRGFDFHRPPHLSNQLPSLHHDRPTTVSSGFGHESLALRHFSASPFHSAQHPLSKKASFVLSCPASTWTLCDCPRLDAPDLKRLCRWSGILNAQAGDRETSGSGLVAASSHQAIDLSRCMTRP
jgi:hypothetical protein